MKLRSLGVSALLLAGLCPTVVPAATTTTYHHRREAHPHRKTVKRVGVGAAGGAAVGALLGGGKGAAVGALVGGGSGAIYDHHEKKVGR